MEIAPQALETAKRAKGLSFTSTLNSGSNGGAGLKKYEDTLSASSRSKRLCHHAEKLNSEGGTPKTRLNARVKLMGELNPDAAAAYFQDLPLFARAMACSSFRRSTNSRTASPVRDRNIRWK